MSGSKYISLINPTTVQAALRFVAARLTDGLVEWERLRQRQVPPMCRQLAMKPHNNPHYQASTEASGHILLPRVSFKAGLACRGAHAARK